MNGLNEHTDLSELPQEFSITEKDNSKRQNEAGAEEGDDVAVIGHIVGIPVQGWTRNVSFNSRKIMSVTRINKFNEAFWLLFPGGCLENFILTFRKEQRAGSALNFSVESVILHQRILCDTECLI